MTTFDMVKVSRVGAALASYDYRGLCYPLNNAAWVLALYPELDIIIGEGFDDPDAAWAAIDKASQTRQLITSEISLQLTARHFVKQHYATEDDGA